VLPLSAIWSITMWGIALVVIIALLSLQLSLLTADGAVAACLVGIAVISTDDWSPTCMLLCFFTFGSLATKFKQSYKESKMPHTDPNDEKNKKKGRGAGQVLATGGPPALFCLLSRLDAVPFELLSTYLGTDWSLQLWYLLCTAFLSCCLGDTLASEIGMLAGQQPRQITTLRPCLPGLDGGISLLGTVASMCGGLLIGVFTLSWPGVLYCTVWGTLGSAVDSVLGSVLQSSLKQTTKSYEKWHFYNWLVNLLSSLVTCVIAVVMISLEGSLFWWLCIAAVPVLLIISAPC